MQISGKARLVCNCIYSVRKKGSKAVLPSMCGKCSPHVVAAAAAVVAVVAYQAVGEGTCSAAEQDLQAAPKPAPAAARLPTMASALHPAVATTSPAAGRLP